MQSGYRVDAHGLTRGNITSDQGDGSEQQRYGTKRYGIGSGDSIQQGRQQFGHCKRACESQYSSRSNQARTSTDNQHTDVARPSAQGYPDADLSCPQSNRITHNRINSDRREQKRQPCKQAKQKC